MAPHRQKRIARTFDAFAAAFPLMLVCWWFGIDLLWSLTPVVFALIVHAAQLIAEDGYL